MDTVSVVMEDMNVDRKLLGVLAAVAAAPIRRGLKDYLMEKAVAQALGATRCEQISSSDSLIELHQRSLVAASAHTNVAPKPAAVQSWLANAGHRGLARRVERLAKARHQCAHPDLTLPADIALAIESASTSAASDLRDAGVEQDVAQNVELDVELETVEKTVDAVVCAKVQDAPVALQRRLPSVQDKYDECELYVQRSKLFVRSLDGEWKERGLGEAKLLQHKGSGKVRLALCDENTQQVVANHYVVDSVGTGLPFCELTPNQGSERSWVWKALDSTGTGAPQGGVCEFALKFGNKELADKFKIAFNGAKFKNKAAMMLQQVPMEHGRPPSANTCRGKP